MIIKMRKIKKNKEKLKTGKNWYRQREFEIGLGNSKEDSDNKVCQSHPNTQRRPRVACFDAMFIVNYCMRTRKHHLVLLNL